jgi:hypothetical protein
MKVLISGASGFIGSNLSKFLQKNGYEIHSLLREDFESEFPVFQKKIESCPIIIHLAGAPIIKRWTKKYKKILYSSRIDTTKKISEAIKNAHNNPKLFISTSAIGIYDSIHEHTEKSTFFPNDFLSNLCQQWESEAFKAQEYTRTVVFRLGIVLSKNGGAFPQMAKPFKLGIGGKIGHGKQHFSWIHLQDLLNAYLFTIQNAAIQGVCNLTSPDIIDNKTFTKLLSKALNKPGFFTVPPFILKLIYGKAANTLLSGQKAYPQKLLENNFKFEFDNAKNTIYNLTK